MQTQFSDLPVIPAMTTDAERECYYRLVKDRGEGAVIEFGAWLGASTAYIAAAMRDSGGGKAHVYDKFQSKPLHGEKVKAFFAKKGMTPIVQGPCLDQFKSNLGPLMDYVEVHHGQIEKMKWGDERVAVMITDAPKRVPAISAVMTILRKGLQPGSVMAWQDFGHFPSYEIPACLYHLREHIELVEAVVPGTTLVFRVKHQWEAAQVTRDALALDKWTPDAIEQAWAYWIADFVPAEKAAMFNCGRAMFLCDIGYHAEAVAALAEVHEDAPEEIMPKWRYLADKRPAFVERYAPLFGFLNDQGALQSA